MNSHEEYDVLDATETAPPAVGDVSDTGTIEVAPITAEEHELSQKSLEALMTSVRSNIESGENKILLSQFNEEHFLDLEGEHLEYAMIEGVEKELGTAPAEWAVFIGGLASVKEDYKKEMLDLARSGKRVLFVAPEKGVPTTREDEDYFIARAGALPETIRNKAEAAAQLLEHLGITGANIIGHSQGGAVATALVGMRPGLAKRLLLDNPVGIIGGDTTRNLLSRAHHEAKGGAGATDAFRGSGALALQLMRYPVWRATKEIPSIARTDIRPMLAHMKKLKADGGKGPEIVLINSNSDLIYTKEDVEKGLGDDPLNEYIDRYVVRADKDAGHQKFGDRDDGELELQIIDDRSLIHQIINEPTEVPGADRQQP